MTQDEFLDEIRYLEAAKSGPPARSKEDKEFLKLRRTAIFDVVQVFSVEVLAEARIRL